MMRYALVTLILTAGLGVQPLSDTRAQDSANIADSMNRGAYLFRGDSLFLLRQYYHVNNYRLGNGDLNTQFQTYVLDSLLVSVATTTPATQRGPVYYTTQSTLKFQTELLDPSELNRLTQLAGAGLLELAAKVQKSRVPTVYPSPQSSSSVPPPSDAGMPDPVAVRELIASLHNMPSHERPAAERFLGVALAQVPNLPPPLADYVEAYRAARRDLSPTKSRLHY
jgi:hypothetical protein